MHERTICHYVGQRPVEGSRELTCILQDPLQKNWVLSYSLGYQQDALWDLSAPHQGVSTLLLERQHLKFNTIIPPSKISFECLCALL